MVAWEKTEFGMQLVLTGEVSSKDLGPDVDLAALQEHDDQQAIGLSIDMQSVTSIDREAWDLINRARESCHKRGVKRSAMVFTDRSAMKRFSFTTKNFRTTGYEKCFFTAENPTCGLDVKNWLVYGAAAVSL